MSKIKDYMKMSPMLFTGGQPTAEQLVMLCRSGFNVVINLGLSDAEYSVKNEGMLLENSGVSYIHIPVEFSSPTKAKLLLFFDCMKRHENKKIFVHCAANKRASCFLALWAEFHLGWSKDEANEYIEKVWKPNKVWSRFVDKMRPDIECHR